MLKAFLRILLQTTADDSLQRWRKGFRSRGNRWWVFVEDRAHGFGRGGLLEGTLSGEHFVENYTEGKDVAARVDSASPDLLWRHVSNCSYHMPGVGLMLDRGGRGVIVCALGLRQFG